MFSLDDSLADIKTIGDLFEYLGVVSERARLVQPLSSAYFVEKKGELKVLEGMRPWHSTVTHSMVTTRAVDACWPAHPSPS